MTVKFSPEQWQKVEEKVGSAELAERKRQLAESELYDETGLTKAERDKLTKDELLERKDIAEIAQELEGEKEALAEEINELLGTADSPERALIALRRKNLFRALRENRKIEAEEKQFLEKESALLKSISQAEERGYPARGKSAVLDKVRGRLDKLNGEQTKLLESSPEAYLGLHLKKLKEYKKSLDVGELVETPYVKEQSEDIMAHFNSGTPVMIYGHLGSGKTELAMQIAKKYIGKEALVISGSKHTSLAELYGHQVLDIDKIDKKELSGFIKEVEEKFNEWAEKNPKADEGDKNRAHDRILQTYLTQFAGGTISDFFMGPIYRAMEEGRPVIIDEVNAIPHEVLISLNHILTRRVGDKMNIQQDSGKTVEVKEGFGIIMTGNLNQSQEKYIDRQDMDPAFLSRLYKLKYDYLPQEKEGPLAESKGEDELFHLVLTMMMDTKGNMDMPKDSVAKLWRLAEAARLTQDVFAGKEVSKAHYLQEGGGRAAKYLLKESVMSPRAIKSVLDQWKEERYKYELDYYIWKDFISQSTVASDRAYLYQEFKDRYGFFGGQGWEQNPDYGAGGVIDDFDIKPPKNKSEKKEFLGPRQTVEYAYGAPPERAKWPEMNANAGAADEADKELNMEELEELEKFSNSFDADMISLDAEILEFCKIGQK